MTDIILVLQIVLSLLVAAVFAYQGIFLLIGLRKRRETYRYEPPETNTYYRYAAVVCARNEEEVIGELITSLRNQNYPQEQLDIYVMADNCTDRTAEKARKAGAVVFERCHPTLVGKGYALDELFERLHRAGLRDRYDGFFIFDADNLVDENFVHEMNKTIVAGDYAAVTGYRNAKNFDENWLSSGYALWFLKEARFLNYPRTILGSNCTVSGTGFFVSNHVIQENGGWPFHLLTEDLQFSADCTAEGKRIGYCEKAIIYDEQPTSFSQSWHQRLRWCKGFYQVAWRYAPQLLKGMKKGGTHALSCYDVLITAAPGLILIASMVFGGVLTLAQVLLHSGDFREILLQEIAFLTASGLIGYFGCMALGAVTLYCEWDGIPWTDKRNVYCVFTFPLFMLSYVPIALTALCTTVEWKPIRHRSVQKGGNRCCVTKPGEKREFRVKHTA